MNFVTQQRNHVTSDQIFIKLDKKKLKKSIVAVLLFIPILIKDVTRQKCHQLVKMLLDMESAKNHASQTTAMITNIPNQIILLKAIGQNVKSAQLQWMKLTTLLEQDKKTVGKVMTDSINIAPTKTMSVKLNF